ncbi:MAG: GntR family transcriptional regulator [Planctomycetes bacterium]|nr:GntR family transcriptional regulator [Planctomycetota bacterium]
MPSVRTRPPIKQRDITEKLRRLIVSGRLRPGARLPTRAKLQQQYDASTTTVQRAVDVLLADGFLVARGTLGTFVVEYPPHLHHFGLVFEQELGRATSRYLSTLADAARALAAGPSPRVTIYDGVNMRADNAQHRRLVDDAAAHRLAGVFFANQPWQLYASPLITAPDLPRAALMIRGTYDGDMIAIGLDAKMLLQRSCAHLRDRGRKRVAVIAGYDAALPDQVLAAAAKHGLDARPYWIQWAATDHPASARASAHLLFQGGAQSRPDALIVLDDNLVEQAIYGLMDAGVTAPRDVEVVAHANFPGSYSEPMRYTRIGFDVRRILATAFRALHQQRMGERVEDLILPAEFEAEVAARNPGEDGVWRAERPTHGRRT